MDAVASGNMDLLKEILSEIKMDEKSRERLQPQLNYALLQAVLGCSKPMIAMLIEAGAECNAFKETCPLVNEAASLNDEAVLELLVKHGADAECSTKQGSLLHCAARTGNLKLAQEAVSKYGCHPNEQDAVGRTPLHIAVIFGHTDIVRYFQAELDCDINSSTSFGSTAVHLAARGGDVDILKLLPDIKNEDCVTDKDGYTAWMLAVTNNNHKVAELMEETLDLSAPIDKQGNTMLHFVAQAGSIVCLKRLLDLKPDLNVQNKKGNTPLMLAVHSKRWLTCNYLAKAGGCNVNIKNKENVNALTWALQGPFEACMEHILNSLVAGGVLVNDVEEGQQSLLMKYFHTMSKAKWLLKAHADPNYHIPGNTSLLIEAAKSDSFDQMELLLEANVDMLKSDRVNSQNHTALQVAIYQQNEATAMTLLRLGCSLKNMESMIYKGDLRRHTFSVRTVGKKVKWRMNHPLSLMEIARLNVLSNLQRQGTLKSRIERLKTPTVLKNYLQWEWFLDEYETPRSRSGSSSSSADLDY